MSTSSIIGAVGVNIQSVKGTAVPPTTFTPATQVDLAMDQLAEALPAEVGGTYFRRGAYKHGIRGSGGFSALVRPGTIAPVLQAWFGQNTGGVYTPITTAALPYATLVKDDSTLLAEEFFDARIRQLTFTVPAGRPIMYKTEWVAANAVETAVLTRPITFETELPMQACVSVVSINGASNTNSAKATNIVIDLTNQVTDDEFSIGNYFLDDVTLLERGAKIQYELILRDAVLWREVYRNGAATAGTVTNLVAGGWSPTIFSGALSVDLKQTTNTTPGELLLAIPLMDFMALPIALDGNQLVRVRLEAQITIHAGVTDPITATLTQPVA